MLAAIANTPAFNDALMVQPRMQKRRKRPAVQRMVTSSSAEIQAWNAAVEQRKAAKKAGRA